MAYMDEALRARLVELAEEIEHSTFRETKWGRRGYAEKDVDDFLDYVVDVLAGLLSMDSAPHVVSVEAEPAEEVSYEQAPHAYAEELSYEQPAAGEGAVEAETVLVTSTPEPAAPVPPPVGEDEPEVTWNPPQSPFRAPPEDAVLVSSDDDVAVGAVEVEQEATVAWQPDASEAEAEVEAVPEVDAAPPPAAPVQPRPAGKPRTRPGGPQPPPPPWATGTG
ncbi:MAG: DivIVA domain-containing protein [Acidimicrobiia bacterium]|nr:DivIVA domain-containing protein [Acidimicrobiia bacterium]